MASWSQSSVTISDLLLPCLSEFSGAEGRQARRGTAGGVCGASSSFPLKGVYADVAWGVATKGLKMGQKWGSGGSEHGTELCHTRTQG